MEGQFSLNSPIPPASLPSSPVPQCDLSLPASASLPPALTTVIASLGSGGSSPSSRTKDGLIRMLLQSTTTSQETTSPDPALARSLSLVQLDHSYSKPWNWRPESCLCQPTKTLFVPGTERSTALEADQDEGEVYVDVVTESAKQSPVYDPEQASKLMGECQRFLSFAKPTFGEEETKDEEDDMVGWEEKIPKESWSSTQSKVFGRVMKVLCQDRLARLAEAGGEHEPVLRRLTIDKSCRRLRSVLASPPCLWDHHLLQWLHNTLSSYLPNTLLAAWLDILQALRSKVPGLMERLLANAAGHHIDPKARSLAQEGLSLLLRRPWDPAASSIASRRLARLPGNPILIVAPPGPDNRDGKTISKRMRLWNTQLGCLGKVIVINMPPPRAESALRTGLNFYLHQMVTATLNKVREIRNSSEGRPVVLLGWGPGAAIAAHVASIEKLGGLVCLGFPVSTLAGTRGQVGDTLLDLKTPGLFVVGERASQCNTDDVEDIRERMSVETGLVIVGGADDQLRMTNKKKKSELVTQSIVDRCIIDQIRNFLVSVLIKQPQSFGAESTFAVPTPESFGKKVKTKKRGGGEISAGEPPVVSAVKKSRPGGVATGSPAASLTPLPKTPPKKTRKPKKPKVTEGEAGVLLTNPLPASLLSISAPLPPTTLSPLKEPPPLPIRLPPAPGSPTPRVIHYAGRTGADNPTTPTWTVAVSRPVTATRPHQMVISGHRPSTVQIQLPSPGLVRQHQDKLLILMSPTKEQSEMSPGQVSPSKLAGGLIVSPGPNKPNKQSS